MISSQYPGLWCCKTKLFLTYFINNMSQSWYNYGCSHLSYICASCDMASMNVYTILNEV